MVKRARTKDETFMVRLYEEASKQDEMDQPLDRYHVGQLAGIQQRGVDAICHLLIQANFVKKEGAAEISITPHGVKLVQSLLDSQNS